METPQDCLYRKLGKGALTFAFFSVIFILLSEALPLTILGTSTATLASYATYSTAVAIAVGALLFFKSSMLYSTTHDPAKEPSGSKKNNNSSKKRAKNKRRK